MKRMILALAAACTTATAVRADDYPYLTFESGDGTQISFASSALSITYSDGKLTVNDGTNSQVLEAADLSRMFFSSSEANAISGVAPADGEGSWKAYSLAGIHLGDFTGKASLEEQLPAGVYIVKTKSQTFKIAVK